MERALAHLKHTIWAFNTAMDPWFAKEPQVEGDEKTWQHRYEHLRRALLKQANDIVDEYGPDSEDPEQPGVDMDPQRKMRIQVLWDMYSAQLEDWGIIRTEDKKYFTFAKREDVANAA